MTDDDVQELAALCKNAFYAARDGGGTMHTAADDAARAILDSGWLAVHDIELLGAERRAWVDATGEPTPAHVRACVARIDDSLTEIARQRDALRARLAELAEEWKYHEAGDISRELRALLDP